MLPAAVAPSDPPGRSIHAEVAALVAAWAAAAGDERARAHAGPIVRAGLARLRALWRGRPDLFDPGSVAALRAMAREVEAAGAAAAEAVLRDLFGYGAFRPGQAEVITAVLGRRDTVGIMPTGAGKSLTYQIPARVLGGTTLVISPLVALMKDQVDGAAEVGLRATFLNSTLAPDQRRERVADMLRGAYELVYAAPEGIEAWLGTVLQRVRLSLIAVDEAHCISHWGHEFRPSYRNLQDLKRRLGDVPVLALTATAKPAVAADIIEQLGMRDPFVYRGSVFRANLDLAAYRKGDDLGGVRKAVLAIARARSGESGIVYCTSRKSAESTAEFLSSKGVRAAAYHAGLEPQVRTCVQDAFLHDDVDVVVATVAFGMGIDKSNIRFVVHRDMPRSVEAYYQEVGRAGRDGLPSTCVLFYSWADVLALDRFTDDVADPEVGRLQREQARDMFALAEARACRHREVARHLGEATGPCGSACDVCTGRDLLAALRERQARDRPRRRRAGTEAALAEAALADPAIAHPVLEEEALFLALKRLRKEIADARRVPAYVVFGDATLREMAARRPRTLDELAGVHGVGPKKLADHGPRFLELLRGARPA